MVIYIYIYIYIYIHTHTYPQFSLHMQTYRPTLRYLHTHTHIYIYIYTRIITSVRKILFSEFFPQRQTLHYLVLIFSKEYCNIAKIFVLRLFKMAENQTKCSRLEQSFVIKVLVAEKNKPYEIYRRICDLFREA